MITLSVSRDPVTAKIDNGDHLAWRALYKNMQTVQLSTIGIANAIYKGHVIGPVTTGWRGYEYFTSTQLIGVDIDTEDQRAKISVLIEHDLVQMYGALVYSTMSSTPDAPRSRIVFLLDQPITCPYKAKAAIRTLSAYFDGYDKSSAEPTRMWYGNNGVDTDGIYVTESLLPLADLRQMYKTQQVLAPAANRPTPNYTSSDLDIDALIKGAINKASPGQRNSLCYWMACRMVESNVSPTDMESAVTQFASAMGSDFTIAEAMQCLKSAKG